MEKNITLISTGAIGDLVIATALAPALAIEGYHTNIVSKGFTLPLLNGLENITGFDSAEKAPKDLVVDISDYLIGKPHSENLPSEYATVERKGHLSEWMGYRLFKSGVTAYPSRNDVKIALTQEEVRNAVSRLHEISNQNDGKPVVIFAPYSTTKNRNMTQENIEWITKKMASFAVPCLLDKEKKIDGMVSIWDESLRNSSALLYAADGVVAVDPGPLHMANAVLNGTAPELGWNEGVRIVKPSKILAILGSSSPEAVTYEGNKFVKGTGCPKGPDFACGAHGYLIVKAYSDYFNTEFYPDSQGKSGCVAEDYASIDAAPCMNINKIALNELMKRVPMAVPILGMKVE